ncbi:DUF4355 domain-containing protein [Lactobacillus sp.]|uniref:DUF4355 domain-containing protein n=1 Tax=Lactobacillus sp. TaxID=1591 RepID=UPI0019C6B2EE|nr:DUF4355 domain-containing protein [Lactobacillus sp.]MBD5429339.1 DUF4355 domain-containing protein [Lactobacillus sp.]MBD5430004.1 DUF4355 domain-containing protein [Lactobacillus sp.]
MAEEKQEQSSVGETEKTFTQDQVNEMIKKRIERERKDQAEKITAAKDEATKLAKMNRDQKNEYELKQAKQVASDAQSKLAKYEMRDQACQMLKDEDVSLTSDELSLVVTDDAKTTQDNVKLVSDLVKRIKNEVREDFRKGKTPVVKNNTMTKKEIMGIKDTNARLKAIGEHRDLFN